MAVDVQPRTTDYAAAARSGWHVGGAVGSGYIAGEEFAGVSLVPAVVATCGLSTWAELRTGVELVLTPAQLKGPNAPFAFATVPVHFQSSNGLTTMGVGVDLGLGTGPASVTCSCPYDGCPGGCPSSTKLMGGAGLWLNLLGFRCARPSLGEEDAM